ncbi:hypothetical protein L4D06_16010 [Enterovibrio makurazakiensis]|uniref:Uncharacterized protein n=1 Tax=Enterovibrio gelatinilyticus TaxID=2899819 RepID=A0ABT5R3J4_9GAMM|nr:hypothetical protein [Enterovibrio sp. ZSDZ42]MDD1794455.1 hypothetical protein [Enterovibrio sp. ZSDZ42]
MICMNEFGELLHCYEDKQCPVEGSVYVEYLDGEKKGNYYIELEPESLVEVYLH